MDDGGCIDGSGGLGLDLRSQSLISTICGSNIGTLKKAETGHSMLLKPQGISGIFNGVKPINFNGPSRLFLSHRAGFNGMAIPSPFRHRAQIFLYIRGHTSSELTLSRIDQSDYKPNKPRLCSGVRTVESSQLSYQNRVI